MSAGPPDPRPGTEATDPHTITGIGGQRREYVERARQYHAEHVVWPPDPLLEEVDEMRRQIMAEHGNDWRKVLAWYGELDEQRRPQAEAHPSAPSG